MNRIWKGSAALLAVVALAAMMVGGASAASDITYKITITNTTTGQPFSPPIVVAHTSEANVFTVGEKASVGVQTIAETGSPANLAAALTGATGVLAVETFGGPILAGASASLEIKAPPGMYLSVVTMLICTNDGITGVSNWKLPANGSDSVAAMAYDAGTEINTELTVDIVDPCGGAGPVAFAADGNGRTGSSANIEAHPGIAGIGDLTVADHGWTGSVATIDIVAVDSPAPPAVGSAGLVAEGSGGLSYPWFGIVGGALVLLAGAAFAGSRRIGARS
jgi:Spondin_N